MNFTYPFASEMILYEFVTMIICRSAVSVKKAL
jgi:hypothetical protein